MIDELIDKKTQKQIMVFLFVVSIFLLMWGSFKLGEVYVCKKSGMELLIEPEFKCISKAELERMENPTPWWKLINETFNQTLTI